MKEITLKVKDIKEYILADFGKLMAAEGFLYKKTNNEFIRSNGDYTYIFNMMLTSWSSSYEISVRLFISQKRIESVYQSILGKSHKLTVGENMIERIFYSPDGRRILKGDSMGIWLTKDADILNTMDVLKIYYNKIARPYFEKFTTLESFDDYMNNPPFEHPPAYVGGMFKDRYMKGLIVAKLVNNPNYEKLVTIYDELIKGTLSSAQPDSIINYNRVKGYLNDNSISIT